MMNKALVPNGKTVGVGDATVQTKRYLIYQGQLLVLFSVILMSLAVSAQDHVELPLIVVLGSAAPADQMQAFEQGLQDLGHINGSTVSIKYLLTQNDDKIEALAREAVALKPKVIAAVGSKAGRAAQHATRDIPIVVVTGNITVAGLVENLARPEGNVTGLSFFNVDLRLKQFEILVELAPQIRHLNFFFQGQATPTQQESLTRIADIANEKGITLNAIPAEGVESLKSALAKLPASSEDGVFILASVAFDTHPAEIGQLTAEHHLIAMLPWKSYVQAGGLISYSPDIVAIWGRASSYVDRLLRGAEPGDLPVERPRKFELVINLRTAKALGLAVPVTLLLQADEVIK